MPETHPIQLSPNPRYGSNSGQPFTRRDAILKVTGRATYAADNHPEGMLYAVYAVSTIARGRVTHLDVEAARAHPHVVEVITPANRPPLAGDPEAKGSLFAFRMEALQNDSVRYANQPIALVVATTLEAATEGAALLEAALRGRAGAPRTRRRAFRAEIRGGRPARERRAWRRRSGARGRAAAHRRDLRNAAAIPQRDGAARHRRMLGRRPPDPRHAEPGAAHGPRSLRRLLRRPARERAHSHPLHRRRLRIEGDPRRAAYPRASLRRA